MKSFRYGEKGFTLIELLVVVAILGILAAVVIPNLTSFIGMGKTEAMATEKDVIQTALVAYMAANNVSVVPAQTTSTNNMANSTPPLATYLVESTTAYYYTWTTGAIVSQQEGPPQP